MQNKEHDQSKNLSKKLAQEIVYNGKWLRMNLVDFSNGKNIIKNYETVERTTRKADLEYDGVEILGIIRYNDPKKKKKLILIANYRPPVDSFVLEFPAGLMDNNNLVENALRELKEETGYTALRVINKIEQPIIYSDPWKSNESSKCVILEVDGDAPENQNPQQHLEVEENIKVHLVDLDEFLMNSILKLVEEKKYKLEVKIWSISLGLSLNTIFK